MAASTTVTNLSPNTANYFQGRGIVWWKNKTPQTVNSIGGINPAGSGVWRDLGNAPIVQFKPTIKNLDHYSSRTGSRNKDLSVPIEISASFIFHLEEWTQDNLALAMLGSEGQNPINILSLGVVTGSVFLLGTNLIGAPCALFLPIVNLTPTATFDLISDASKFGVLEIAADVLFDPAAGGFGTLEWNTAATAPP
jgi:hypothetical protein